MKGPKGDRGAEDIPKEGPPPLSLADRSAIRLQAMWRCYSLRLRHRKKQLLALKECSCVSLLGGPGSGKGTLAKRLCATANPDGEPVRVVHISTGELITKALTRWHRGNDAGLRARATMMSAAVQDGEHVDSSIVIELLAEVMKRESYQHPGATCILDNFPISPAQLDRYELGDANGVQLPPISRVMVLVCDEETMVYRMTHDPTSPHKKAADDRKSSSKHLSADARANDDGEESMRAAISRWRGPFDSVFAQFQSSAGGADASTSTAEAAEAASGNGAEASSTLPSSKLGKLKMATFNTEGLEPDAVFAAVEPFFKAHLADARKHQKVSSPKTQDLLSSSASLEEKATAQ